jgi:Mn-dependent DtxR family transcriptional regulator
MSDEEIIHNQAGKEMLVAQANLIAKGYLETDQGEFVRLTESGRPVAARIFHNMSDEDKTLIFQLIRETEDEDDE